MYATIFLSKMSLCFLFLENFFLLSQVVVANSPSPVESIVSVAPTEISIVPADAPMLKKPAMCWAPNDFAKDPSVIRFKGKYYMYFSVPPQNKDNKKYGWTIGIAQSDDLLHWEYVKNLLPDQECSQRGFCAPCARVFNNKVYLFYQTYGNGSKDAICMSVSQDGLTFVPNPQNPIFHPSGSWTNGRAIDAEVCYFRGKLFLYAATRDFGGQIQKIIVATSNISPENLDTITPEDFKLAYDGAVLEPTADWETKCIEAPTTIEHNGKLYMFYAGGYNNDPQHIGVAISNDGVKWIRLWNIPFITNGLEGQWNMSESGHPGIFLDDDGQTWLFFQGNNTRGKNWFLSRVKINWLEIDDNLAIPEVVEE